MTYSKILFFSLLAFSFSAHAVEVGKEAWINHMLTVVPVTLCKPEQYFRKCFDVNAERCEDTMASATRVCMNKLANDIPNVLVQPEDGTYWGSRLGTCAGVTFETSLIEERKSDAICNDVEFWK